MSGQAQEHDIPMRARPMPNVWRPNDRMPNMPESGGKKDLTLLRQNHDETEHWN